MLWRLPVRPSDWRLANSMWRRCTQQRSDYCRPRYDAGGRPIRAYNCDSMSTGTETN